MKLLFVALLFLCVAWFADAYECYICNNLMTGACGDPFDKSKISNTSIVEIAPYERCAKSKIGTAVRRTKVNSTECPGAKNGCEPRMDDGVKAMFIFRMFNFNIPALLIGCIPIIICDPNCVYKVDDGLTLDIRTLGFADGKGPKYNHISNAATTANTFSWNGCFSYSTNDQGNCSDAAACYFDATQNKSILIAKQDSTEFKHNQGSFVLSYKSSHGYLTVFLNCRDEDEDSAIGQQHDASTYSIHIQSRCCCPGMCHYPTHYVNPIIIAIIIISIFVLGYILGGILFVKHRPDSLNRFSFANLISYLRHRNSNYQQV
ncbi:unnamed protein product [Adineta ricciae]|uniref:Uncharacterized protein n=1 Tax=Adineta ricciae TaxID=249248 RepID=A0A816DQQ3_ADIRI|nr:unnamed protein product [Adineta ricciae]